MPAPVSSVYQPSQGISHIHDEAFDHEQMLGLETKSTPPAKAKAKEKASSSKTTPPGGKSTAAKSKAKKAKAKAKMAARPKTRASGSSAVKVKKHKRVINRDEENPLAFDYLRTNGSMVEEQDIHPRLFMSPVAREYEKRRLVALYGISPDLKRTKNQLRSLVETLTASYSGVDVDASILEKAEQYMITCPHCDGSQFPEEDKIALREEHDRQRKQEMRRDERRRR
jgi:hypothetical protein